MKKEPSDTLFLSPIGSLGCCVRTNVWWPFHSVLRASQRKINSALPFPSSFSYIPKFRLADFSACYLLHDDILLRLFFYPEDEGGVFVHNVG
jgi:hypothetical protein